MKLSKAQQELELELMLYNDSLEQILVVNPKQRNDDIRLAKMDWNHEISLYGDIISERNKWAYTLEEELRDIKEIDNDICWKSNFMNS